MRALLEDKVNDAIGRGAQLLYGNVRKARCIPDGARPVGADMPVVRTETFGRVAVIRFRTIDEAIEIANSTEYGLSSGSAAIGSITSRASCRNCMWLRQRARIRLSARADAFAASRTRAPASRKACRRR